MISTLDGKSGFLPSPWDPRDAWEDEVMGGDITIPPLPSHYRNDSFKFEPQGAYPFCVSFATVALSEAIFKAKGSAFEFSQEHLFFHSGGTRNGSNFRANLETALQNGCINLANCPMPKNIWEFDDAVFAQEAARAQAISFTGAHKIPGYVRVNPTTDELKHAIMRYGGVLVGVNANTGGYWLDKVVRKSDMDTHAVVLAGWDDDGSWWIFDSLQPTTDFNGYHRFSKDYGFNTAYAVVMLPDSWQQLRDEARTPPPGNAERYGKPRDYAAEVVFASEMLAAFKKFNNESVLAAAGKFWEMLIRAGVYGGYNLSYEKQGVWYPGDLINDVYAWRRTGKHLFNFDKQRDQQ